jgi:hypothetical protein
MFAAAPYTVPEGMWVATIVAPGIGWPSVSVILPLRVDVVTCAIKVAVPKNSNNGMKINFSFRMIGKVKRFIVIFRFKLFIIS